MNKAQQILPLIDPTRCTGCGVCAQLCPTNAVAVRANLAIIVRPQACTYCDLCETYCPEGAIGRPFTIVFAPKTYMERHAIMPTNTMHTPITITSEHTLNAIVARYPQTLPVFQHFGLDTCCGGALPLHTAARHHGLDPAEVLAALRAELERNTR